MNAGKKLIIAMALIAIVPSLTIALAVNQQMQRSIREVQETALESLSNVVSAHIYDFYSAQEMDSRFFGELTTFQKCLEAHKNGDPIVTFWDAEVRKLFQDTSVFNDNVDGGALISADGTTLLACDAREEGKNIAGTEMYRRIMDGEEMYHTTVVSEDGSRNINMVVPVKDDGGTIIGMLKRVVNLSNLSLYINEVEIGETGYVYLVDENATLIYHGQGTNMDLAVGEFQDRSELDDILKQTEAGTLKEKNEIFYYESQGTDIIAAYSRIEELNWLVIVAMDDQEIQAPVERASKLIQAASLFVGLIAALACYFIVNALLRPMTELKKQIKEIAMGNLKARCSLSSAAELAGAMEEVNDIARRLERNESELAYARNHDTLTGMFNRLGALSHIEQRLGKTARQAILLVDLDDFGVINETVGETVGDGVLKETSEKFTTLSDTIACSGRFDGDRFILFVEDWDEEETPEALASRLRAAIGQIRFVADRPVHITASTGVIYVEDAEQELNFYLKRAEIALHKAKNSGKNTDVVFSDEL